ncbi:hypothetical protein GCM10010401_10080 [Rarobacter faecitabidus]|uniref:Membrane protein DedA with SNARE-associated domain n=1 Tax=Rarobacter faecitabidus TaxID=13243 RepID=A0A542Z9Z6_RARFA|nr:hypothetical protein [Rarobacter faecitabidus]TQL57169.1 membrane protein DedA with SNARE-associated domain [Rarobacter faecitabidus]
MAAEVSVPGLPSGAPLWTALVALFVIVMLRSHGTYWIARLAVRGAEAGVHHDSGRAAQRVARWLDAPTTDSALRILRRWGTPAVTVAYVAVGLQTAILIAAGLIKMPYFRFTIASIPGAAAWAVVWGTIGFSVFWSAVRAWAAGPVGIAATAGVILVGALTIVCVHRRRPDSGSLDEPSANLAARTDRPREPGI